MRRWSAWLPMAVLLLLACSCSRKQSRATDAPHQAAPQEAVPEAATEEDALPSAKEVGPIAVWKRDAQAAAAEHEAEMQRAPRHVDHVALSKPEPPKSVLHTAFSVRSYTQFAFVVPPHQGNAHVRGTFRSFTKRSDPNATSNKTADIDLLLLNEQEFNDFLNGRPGDATVEVDAAHDQKLDWAVPATFESQQEYHLVFSNPAGGAKIKFIETDLTISFD